MTTLESRLIAPRRRPLSATTPAAPGAGGTTPPGAATTPAMAHAPSVRPAGWTLPFLAMKVGIPTEIKTDESRVAITPAGVRELTTHGHEVLVQADGGLGAPDAVFGHR